MSTLSLKTLLFLSLVCIIFLISFIYFNIPINNDLTTECSKIDLLSEYNLSKNKLKDKNKNKNDNKLCDKFNIKEFDFINDNIIIHSKFKTELLDYQTNKNLIQSELDKQKKQKELEFNQSFQKNIELETHQQLLKDINKLKSDISSLKLLFKDDITNIQKDIRDNNLTNNEKTELLNIIINEINKSNKILEISKSQETQLNNPDFKIKIKLLMQKIKILEKKINIYTKLFNN